VSPAERAGVVLAAIGHVPLPPYIEKQREGAADEGRDVRSYQTVYAREGRSLAAPTAGLHFTPELLARIEGMGVKRVGVDLEVGLGTFLPVETETLEEHRMHVETFAVPAATVAALREQRRNGGRIVVVGTTAVRTLEAAAARILDLDHPPTEIAGATDLKISPGFGFRLTDVLVTNFHLPRSTLMALVGAMVGVERLKGLYALAVREGYRFYSYGDAMVILP
jgi:S-adenosylmethionine:tRNA ribosyltransferase-isomerase